MVDIHSVAASADFIVNGYCFVKEDSHVKVLNLNHLERAAVISHSGEVLETSMDDIELGIVHGYWEKNKHFMED